MIVHIEGTTLVDYPGKVASTVFIKGCNLRCPFCHNADLVLPELYPENSITEEEALKFILKRKGFISGVVFTGGEPLIWDRLPDFISEIKKNDLKVKLDTNGTFPDRLNKVIPLVDYVAMDIKSSPAGYPAATGGKADFEDVRESIEIIMNSNIEYEFRTTAVPSYVTEKDFIEISKIMEGARLFAIQTFIPLNTLDETCLDLSSYPKSDMRTFLNIMEKTVQKAVIR